MTFSVAFVAAPYGFGPSSKAVAISSYLPACIQRVFIGQGPALEMAYRSNEFSTCMKLDFRGSPTTAEQLLLGFDALVFVNSTRFLSESVTTQRPTILVDTLAWLRVTPPPLVANLRAFFAQRFFDHEFSSVLKGIPNFCPVGPILPKSFVGVVNGKRSAFTTKGPVVHCGGLFSPAMIEGACEEFVTETIRAIGQTNQAMRAILPSQVGELFERNRTHFDGDVSRIECTSLDAPHHISGSEFALTTTGIEFTYESFLLGVPTIFLPPFNASQRFQLDFHKRLCAESVPFDVGSSVPLNFERLHEATADIQRVGVGGVWGRQFSEVARFLSSFTKEKRRCHLDKVRTRQKSMAEGLDLNGAEIIASRVMNEVKSERIAS